WKVPVWPVIPWVMTLEFLLTRMDILVDSVVSHQVTKTLEIYCAEDHGEACGLCFREDRVGDSARNKSVMKPICLRPQLARLEGCKIALGRSVDQGNGKPPREQVVALRLIRGPRYRTSRVREIYRDVVVGLRDHKDSNFVPEIIGWFDCLVTRV